MSRIARVPGFPGGIRVLVTPGFFGVPGIEEVRGLGCGFPLTQGVQVPRDGVEHRVDVRLGRVRGIVTGQADGLVDRGDGRNLRIEEQLPHGDTEYRAFHGRKTTECPVLHQVAGDRVIDAVELAGRPLDDRAGVLRDWGDVGLRKPGQFDPVIHDGDGVDVAGFRLEEDVDGPTACAEP